MTPESVAAYRYALQRITDTVEARFVGLSIVALVPGDLHRVVELARAVLQSPDPGKALLDAHATEIRTRDESLAVYHKQLASAWYESNQRAGEIIGLRQRAEAAEAQAGKSHAAALGFQNRALASEQRLETAQAEAERLRGVDVANRALCEWQKETQGELQRLKAEIYDQKAGLRLVQDSCFAAQCAAEADTARPDWLEQFMEGTFATRASIDRMMKDAPAGELPR